MTADPDRPPVQGVAGRYAQALLDHACETKSLTATLAGAEALRGMIDSSPDLRAMLANPLLQAPEQGAALGALAERAGFNPPLRRFLGLLAEHRRLAILPEILRGLRELADARAGLRAAAVWSAQALTAPQRTALRAKIAALAGVDARKMALREAVDPALLGGMIVQVGPYRYDSSLKSRLQRLRAAMKDAA